MEGVRPATESDVDRILELARAMRAEFTSMRGGPMWVLNEKGRASNISDLLHVMAQMADGQSRVSLGTIDGAAMGFAIGVIDTLDDGSLLGVVTDLFVEEQAREVGIGEAMLDDMTTFFAEHGCVGIDAIALPGDRSTKNFFEEQGFKARLLRMHRKLADVGPAS